MEQIQFLLGHVSVQPTENTLVANSASGEPLTTGSELSWSKYGEGLMAAGDPQRVWFTEMIEELRASWHPGMSFASLIELRDVLDSMLHRIRSDRSISAPIITCQYCGYAGPAAEPEVSVRAMILSLSRFGIADLEEIKILERGWAKYRKQNKLDLNGRVATKAESAVHHCQSPAG